MIQKKVDNPHDLFLPWRKGPKRTKEMLFGGYVETRLFRAIVAMARRRWYLLSRGDEGVQTTERLIDGWVVGEKENARF
jgi:hypothetical protein